MGIPNVPSIEKEVLEYWKKNAIFKKSLEKKSPKGNYGFFEGPPTANGKPGVHHVLSRAFKDVYPRFKTMQGYNVPRKAGWDTHGLPVELQIEKKLEISGKKEIENIVEGDVRASIIEFNKQCKESVWEFKTEFEEMTERMGYWLEIEDAYITYTNEYIESVWWILGQLWKKGLLYRGHKVVPYCARCGTGLSSHEVAQGYKKITEPSVYVALPLTESTLGENVSLLVWTTTPWTLPGNVGVAVNPTLSYAVVRSHGKLFVVAESRAAEVFKGEPYKTEQTFLGKDIIGAEYKPLFNKPVEQLAKDESVFRVVGAEFVEASEGTGLVHMAPAFGEEDNEVGKKENLPVLTTIDTEGKILKGLGIPGEGEFAKEADPKIIEWLESEGLLLKTEDTTHEYPFCWRCDTPLLYYAKPSYFIAMTKVKERLVANNKNIEWVPEYMRDGRMGEWLANVKDWALSRDRYWGTPLPIWRTEDEQETFLGITQNAAQEDGAIVKAIEDFRTKMSKETDNGDYHIPFIDDVTFKHPETGEKMKRVPEVIDVWFDAGAMPYAQAHVPFDMPEDKAPLQADYISEAIDQTRGWFYTLQAIAAALGNDEPYKHVITFAHVLDKNGKKMSKSKGNVINPIEMGDEFGFDSIRWFFYTVSQPGTPIKFNPDELKKVQRRMFNTLLNSFSFYRLYNQDPQKDTGVSTPPKHEMDQWLLARLNEVGYEVTTHLEEYQVVNAARRLEEFVNELSTKYIQLSRDRFRDGNKESIEVLGVALITVSKLLAPFAPFTAEYLFREMTGDESVHLVDWPEFSEEKEEITLKMEEVWGSIEAALALRAEAKIKVRQPLSGLVVPTEFSATLNEIIANRVNVKKVTSHGEETWPEGDEWIGKKGVLSLNTKLTAKLKDEGALRELTRQINALRKKQGFTIQDTVTLWCKTSSETLTRVLDKYADELKKAVLAKDIVAGEGTEELSIDGEVIFVALKH
ncbi:MAG: isoleucine--tRNA ligase [Candidatus Jacksonbacteria bacterium]|nr:isoleucine--tRNA ligase [Candidatus Jacksonbacteria bacterium]